MGNAHRKQAGQGNCDSDVESKEVIDGADSLETIRAANEAELGEQSPPSYSDVVDHNVDDDTACCSKETINYDIKDRPVAHCFSEESSRDAYSNREDTYDDSSSRESFNIVLSSGESSREGSPTIDSCNIGGLNKDSSDVSASFGHKNGSQKLSNHQGSLHCSFGIKVAANSNTEGAGGCKAFDKMKGFDGAVPKLCDNQRLDPIVSLKKVATSIDNQGRLKVGNIKNWSSPERKDGAVKNDSSSSSRQSSPRDFSHEPHSKEEADSATDSGKARSVVESDGGGKSSCVANSDFDDVNKALEQIGVTESCCKDTIGELFTSDDDMFKVEFADENDEVAGWLEDEVGGEISLENGGIGQCFTHRRDDATLERVSSETKQRDESSTPNLNDDNLEKVVVRSESSKQNLGQEIDVPKTEGATEFPELLHLAADKAATNLESSLETSGSKLMIKLIQPSKIVASNGSKDSDSITFHRNKSLVEHTERFMDQFLKSDLAQSLIPAEKLSSLAAKKEHNAETIDSVSSTASLTSTSLKKSTAPSSPQDLPAPVSAQSSIVTSTQLKTAQRVMLVNSASFSSDPAFKVISSILESSNAKIVSSSSGETVIVISPDDSGTDTQGKQNDEHSGKEVQKDGTPEFEEEMKETEIDGKDHQKDGTPKTKVLRNETEQGGKEQQKCGTPETEVERNQTEKGGKDQQKCGYPETELQRDQTEKGGKDQQKCGTPETEVQRDQTEKGGKEQEKCGTPETEVQRNQIEKGGKDQQKCGTPETEVQRDQTEKGGEEQQKCGTPETEVQRNQIEKGGKDQQKYGTAETEVQRNQTEKSGKDQQKYGTAETEVQRNQTEKSGKEHLKDGTVKTDKQGDGSLLEEKEPSGGKEGTLKQELGRQMGGDEEFDEAKAVHPGSVFWEGNENNLGQIVAAEELLRNETASEASNLSVSVSKTEPRKRKAADGKKAKKEAELCKKCDRPRKRGMLSDSDLAKRTTKRECMCDAEVSRDDKAYNPGKNLTVNFVEEQNVKSKVSIVAENEGLMVKTKRPRRGRSNQVDVPNFLRGFDSGNFDQAKVDWVQKQLLPTSESETGKIEKYCDAIKESFITENCYLGRATPSKHLKGNVLQNLKTLSVKNLALIRSDGTLGKLCKKSDVDKFLKQFATGSEKLAQRVQNLQTAGTVGSTSSSKPKAKRDKVKVPKETKKQETRKESGTSGTTNCDTKASSVGGMLNASTSHTAEDAVSASVGTGNSSIPFENDAMDVGQEAIGDSDSPLDRKENVARILGNVADGAEHHSDAVEDESSLISDETDNSGPMQSIPGAARVEDTQVQSDEFPILQTSAENVNINAMQGSKISGSNVGLCEGPATSQDLSKTSTGDAKSAENNTGTSLELPAGKDLTKDEMIDVRKAGNFSNTRSDLNDVENNGLNSQASVSNVVTDKHFIMKADAKGSGYIVLNSIATQTANDPLTSTNVDAEARATTDQVSKVQSISTPSVTMKADTGGNCHGMLNSLGTQTPDHRLETSCLGVNPEIAGCNSSQEPIIKSETGNVEMRIESTDVAVPNLDEPTVPYIANGDSCDSRLESKEEKSNESDSAQASDSQQSTDNFSSETKSNAVIDDTDGDLRVPDTVCLEGTLDASIRDSVVAVSNTVETSSDSTSLPEATIVQDEASNAKTALDSGKSGDKMKKIDDGFTDKGSNVNLSTESVVAVSPAPGTSSGDTVSVDGIVNVARKSGTSEKKSIDPLQGNDGLTKTNGLLEEGVPKDTIPPTKKRSRSDKQRIKKSPDAKRATATSAENCLPSVSVPIFHQGHHLTNILIPTGSMLGQDCTIFVPLPNYLKMESTPLYSNFGYSPIAPKPGDAMTNVIYPNQGVFYPVEHNSASDSGNSQRHTTLEKGGNSSESAVRDRRKQYRIPIISGNGGNDSESAVREGKKQYRIPITSENGGNSSESAVRDRRKQYRIPIISGNIGNSSERKRRKENNIPIILKRRRDNIREQNGTSYSSDTKNSHGGKDGQGQHQGGNYSKAFISPNYRQADGIHVNRRKTNHSYANKKGQNSLNESRNRFNEGSTADHSPLASENSFQILRSTCVPVENEQGPKGEGDGPDERQKKGHTYVCKSLAEEDKFGILFKPNIPVRCEETPTAIITVKKEGAINLGSSHSREVLASTVDSGAPGDESVLCGKLDLANQLQDAGSSDELVGGGEGHKAKDGSVLLTKASDEATKEKKVDGTRAETSGGKSESLAQKIAKQLFVDEKKSLLRSVFSKAETKLNTRVLKSNVQTYSERIAKDITDQSKSSVVIDRRAKVDELRSEVIDPKMSEVNTESRVEKSQVNVKMNVTKPPTSSKGEEKGGNTCRTRDADNVDLQCNASQGKIEYKVIRVKTGASSGNKSGVSSLSKSIKGQDTTSDNVYILLENHQSLGNFREMCQIVGNQKPGASDATKKQTDKESLEAVRDQGNGGNMNRSNAGIASSSQRPTVESVKMQGLEVGLKAGKSQNVSVVSVGLDTAQFQNLTKQNADAALKGLIRLYTQKEIRKAFFGRSTAGLAKKGRASESCKNTQTVSGNEADNEEPIAEDSSCEKLEIRDVESALESLKEPDNRLMDFQGGRADRPRADQVPWSDARGGDRCQNKGNLLSYNEIVMNGPIEKGNNKRQGGVKENKMKDEENMYLQLGVKSIVHKNLHLGASAQLVADQDVVSSVMTPKKRRLRKNGSANDAEYVKKAKIERPSASGKALKSLNPIRSLSWRRIRYNKNVIGRKRNLLEPVSTLFSWECSHLFSGRKLTHERPALLNKLQKYNVRMERIKEHYGYVEKRTYSRDSARKGADTNGFTSEKNISPSSLRATASKCPVLAPFRDGSAEAALPESFSEKRRSYLRLQDKLANEVVSRNLDDTFSTGDPCVGHQNTGNGTDSEAARTVQGTADCICAKAIKSIRGSAFENSIGKLARSVTKHVRKRKSLEEEENVCRKCNKVLESAKELTRHLLYHLVDKAVDNGFCADGERPKKKQRRSIDIIRGSPKINEHEIDKDANENEVNSGDENCDLKDETPTKESSVYKAQFWKRHQIPTGTEEEASQSVDAGEETSSSNEKKTVWAPLYFDVQVKPVKWECLNCKKKFRGIGEVKLHADSCKSSGDSEVINAITWNQ